MKIMNTFFRTVVLMTLCAWCANAVVAQDSVEEDVTVITSDKLTFDYQNKYALFIGNVIVEDKDMRLTSDELTVRFDDDGDVEFINAEGQVFIQQADKNARSQTATYNVATGEIVLEGDPQLQRGKNLLFGDRITFWRDQDRLEVFPNARLIIFPDGDEKRESLLP